MSDNRVSFTSLCYITKDHEGRIWLSRLADVEDGILHTPFKSERTDNYFENRDELYRRDGPTAIGTIGVWEWTASPVLHSGNSPFSHLGADSPGMRFSPVQSW